MDESTRNNLVRELMQSGGLTVEDVILGALAVGRDDLWQEASKIHAEFYQAYQNDLKSRPHSQRPKANLRIELLVWKVRMRWMRLDFTTRGGKKARMDTAVTLPAEEGKRSKYADWCYPMSVLLDQIKPREHEVGRMRETEAKLAPLRARANLLGKVGEAVTNHVTNIGPAAERFRIRELSLPETKGQESKLDDDVVQPGSRQLKEEPWDGMF